MPIFSKNVGPSRTNFFKKSGLFENFGPGACLFTLKKDNSSSSYLRGSIVIVDNTSPLNYVASYLIIANSNIIFCVDWLENSRPETQTTWSSDCEIKEDQLLDQVYSYLVFNKYSES